MKNNNFWKSTKYRQSNYLNFKKIFTKFDKMKCFPKEILLSRFIQTKLWSEFQKFIFIKVCKLCCSTRTIFFGFHICRRWKSWVCITKMSSKYLSNLIILYFACQLGDKLRLRSQKKKRRDEKKRRKKFDFCWLSCMCTHYTRIKIYLPLPGNLDSASDKH